MYGKSASQVLANPVSAVVRDSPVDFLVTLGDCGKGFDG